MDGATTRRQDENKEAQAKNGYLLAGRRMGNLGGGSVEIILSVCNCKCHNGGREQEEEGISEITHRRLGFPS